MCVSVCKCVCITREPGKHIVSPPVVVASDRKNHTTGVCLFLDGDDTLYLCDTHYYYYCYYIVSLPVCDVRKRTPSSGRRHCRVGRRRSSSSSSTPIPTRFRVYYALQYRLRARPAGVPREVNTTRDLVYVCPRGRGDMSPPQVDLSGENIIKVIMKKKKRKKSPWENTSSSLNFIRGAEAWAERRTCVHTYTRIHLMRTQHMCYLLIKRIRVVCRQATVCENRNRTFFFFLLWSFFPNAYTWKQTKLFCTRELHSID